jgi:transcriptional regulator with XRE-family HTH domain
MPEDATKPAGLEEPGSEREDPARAIGTRLAEIRTDQGVRVSELARTVGVSASLISQIERGQSRPSVSTLFALAEALAVPVDTFFRDRMTPPRPRSATPVEPEPRPGVAESMDSAAARRYLVHRDERAVVDIDGGVRWERLTPTTLLDLDFLELVYQPHAESHPTLYRHPGMEMVLLLSGELHIHVAFERYDLRAGDSICFPSTIPHRYVNPSDEVARAVTVILLDEATPDEDSGPLRP